MIAYEIYEWDPKDGHELIAVMPERRQDSARITEESITNLGKSIIGESLEIDKLSFLEVVIDESTGKVVQTNPSF